MARPTYEGGQMPLFRRIPKYGFSNFNFARRFEIVNISQLEGIFSDGSVISIADLAVAGLVDNDKSKVKILGDGELTKKLEISAHKFSKSAQEKIAGCGGSAKVVA
jgi:large subunit ribosomal protein L15